MVKNETDGFNERVMNMIKLWDQKIANLRSELNIESIYRKLGTFPKKDEVSKMKEELQAADTKIEESITQIKIMIGKVGQLNEGTQS